MVFSEKHRTFSITIATFSKVVFVSLVFLYGQEFLGKATLAIAMDCVVILLACIYLFSIFFQRSTA
jgi:hypothetical protein